MFPNFCPNFPDHYTVITEIYGADVIYHYFSGSDSHSFKTIKPYPSLESNEQFHLLKSEKDPEFHFVVLKNPVMIDSLFDTAVLLSIDTSISDRIVIFKYKVQYEVFSKEQEIEKNQRQWTKNAIVKYNRRNPRIAYLVTRKSSI